MAASTTAAEHPSPFASPRRPWILFDARASIGECPNGTTAQGLTSNNKSIKVSIWPDDPPALSRLFVNCTDLEPDDFLEDPRIIFAADSFLLLRVGIGCSTKRSWEKYDYFIYQAAQRPSLRLLPKPPSFHDDEAGLLPGRGEHFTVAALSPSMRGFNLHLFKSESWAWITFSNVPIVKPQRACPVRIPRNAVRLKEHLTTTVITLGGEDGTMGWVDLWRGILFCDVLSSCPTLRGVPLPLPLSMLLRGKGIEGCPKMHRGIAVVQGCLRMVDLELHDERLPMPDPETGLINFRVDDWEISTYYNSKISGALEDWKLEHTAKASHIDIDEAMRWQLLQAGLLHVAHGGGTERRLENLLPCQPVLSLDNNGAVYLLAKVKFMQSRAWVLAVDIKGNKIQSLAEFDNDDRTLGLSFAYCPSSISSYMNA